MSNLNQHADRGPHGKLLRSKYRCYYGRRFPSGTPKWWRRLFMTRPRRHVNAACCARITKGADPDAMAFPLGNNKPHVYLLVTARSGTRQEPRRSSPAKAAFNRPT